MRWQPGREQLFGKLFARQQKKAKKLFGIRWFYHRNFAQFNLDPRGNADCVWPILFHAMYHSNQCTCYPVFQFHTINSFADISLGQRSCRALASAVKNANSVTREYDFVIANVLRHRATKIRIGISSNSSVMR